jgi:hypothetical protein
MNTNRDMVAHNKVIEFLNSTSKTAGASNTGSIDTQAALTTSDLREQHTKMLIMFSFIWGSSATLDAVFQHSDDNITFTNHSTMTQMTQASLENTFFAAVKDFKRYVRINLTVGTATTTITILAVASRSRRAPAVQLETELTVTEL